MLRRCTSASGGRSPDDGDQRLPVVADGRIIGAMDTIDRSGRLAVHRERLSRRGVIRTTAVAAAFAALIVTRFASAQVDEATQRVRHGVELRQAGQEDAALVEFRAAYELSHRPIAAAQMGLVEQALGRWLDAERHVREALAASTDAWVTRNRAALEAAYSVVQTHVGTLEVRGEPSGAEVLVEGRVVGTLPLSEPAYALVGSVRLEVRAEGRESVSRRVEILAGQLTREEVALSIMSATAVTRATMPANGATTPVTGPTETAPRNGLGAGHVIAGVGVLGVLVGVVAWGASSSPDPQSCTRTSLVSLACDNPATDVSNSSIASWTAVIAGGVGVTALAIGAVMLLTRNSAAPRHAAMVMPTHGGAGFSFAVRF